MEKGKRQTCRQEKMNSNSNWLGKREGPNFISSYNQWGLKPGVLNVSQLGSGKVQRTLGLSLEERQGKLPADIECGNI